MQEGMLHLLYLAVKCIMYRNCPKGQASGLLQNYYSINYTMKAGKCQKSCAVLIFVFQQAYNDYSIVEY